MILFVWKLFTSLKLTLVVLIVLALGLLVGMFWDQTLALDDHLRGFQNAPWLSDIFIFLELDDVFHSWWFGIVVLLLALNLIACSIERLPKIWFEIQYPERELTERVLKKLSCKAIDIVTIADAKSWMRREFQTDEETAFRQKHQYARCGVYMVHVALLMIMFGSIATTQSGIDGMMVITEGEAEHFVQLKGPHGLSMRHVLDFDVVCTDFRLKTFVDGSPMAFESDLEIIKDKKTLAKQTVRVNEPLQYAGYTFYQASYQPMEGEQLVRVAIAPHGGLQKLYTVPIGTRIEMPDKTIFVPTELVEDYAGLGAALKIQQSRVSVESTEFVVFRQYPDFDPWVRRGEWDVFFQGFDQTYATGISVGRVPAISVVFAGFVVMFIGLWMAFCMNYRRYYARIRRLDNELCELTFAATSYRYPESFRGEFEKRRITI